jgi:threonine/homoserine/homoserine lactone efflux protein
MTKITTKTQRPRRRRQNPETANAGRLGEAAHFGNPKQWMMLDTMMMSFEDATAWVPAC